MALTLDVFDVQSVALGTRRWLAGELRVDLAAIEQTLLALPAVADVAVQLVRPHTKVRINNVVDVVVPVVDADDPEASFPGLTGHARAAGIGRRNVLEGLVVISTSRSLLAPEDGPSIIDMEGPGASLVPWSEVFAIVLAFQLDTSQPLAVGERSVRLGSLRVARDLAFATVGAMPDHTLRLSLDPAPASLPAVALILQVGAEGVGRDTYFHGDPANLVAPRVVDPLEILDGALVSGAYGEAGTRNLTAFYQRNRLVRRLLSDHGRRLRFCGVVLTLGYLDDATAKRRMAEQAIGLAVDLGAEGAVLTTFGGGNSHTDTMLTCQVAEERGIRTVVIVAETNGGLTDYVPAANAIISTGNEDEVVSGWTPDEVVGGDRLPDGRDAHDAGPMRTLHYVGAVAQMGDSWLTAAPA